MAEISTCQVCARAIKLVRGSIAHHGFNRPRYYGGQTASCMGARFEPFERSRDRLADVLEIVKGQIERHRASIEAMRAEPRKVIDRSRSRGYRRGCAPELVWVEPGEPLYTVRQREWFARMEGELRALSAELAEQTARYDGWSPAKAGG